MRVSVKKAMEGAEVLVPVTFGRNKEGYLCLTEGQSLRGYFEKMVVTEKYSQPLVFLLSEDRKERYMIFAPRELVEQIAWVEENYGKGVWTEIVYNGKKSAYSKQSGKPYAYHEVEVYVETDERL